MSVNERAHRHRAEQVATLGALESFGVLREEADLEAERIRVRLHGALLEIGISASDLQRQADYDRGFVDGMRYITISVVARATRAMQKNVAIEEEPEEDRWSYAG